MLKVLFVLSVVFSFISAQQNNIVLIPMADLLIPIVTSNTTPLVAGEVVLNQDNLLVLVNKFLLSQLFFIFAQCRFPPVIKTNIFRAGLYSLGMSPTL